MRAQLSTVLKDFKRVGRVVFLSFLPPQILDFKTDYLIKRSKVAQAFLKFSLFPKKGGGEEEEWKFLNRKFKKEKMPLEYFPSLPLQLSISGPAWISYCSLHEVSSFNFCCQYSFLDITQSHGVSEIFVHTPIICDSWCVHNIPAEDTAAVPAGADPLKQPNCTWSKT